MEKGIMIGCGRIYTMNLLQPTYEYSNIGQGQLYQINANRYNRRLLLICPQILDLFTKILLGQPPNAFELHQRAS